MTLLDGASQSRSIYMQPWLLYLKPNAWEKYYYAQFEALDMINCLICPIFFADMLSRWPKSFLTLVYGIVLALKGYQFMLLVIPAARARHAHAHARYWIILTERILRQWVATPALGRGPKFVAYLHDTAAADPGPATAVKLLLQTSGIIHATWNVFCLPLDIVTQVVINVCFVCINTITALCQVAYTVAMLVRAKPQLVWCQWAIERSAAAMLWPVCRLLGGCARADASNTQNTARCVADDAGSRSTSVPTTWSDIMQAQSQLVAMRPGPAPDLETLSGRLVLSGSMALLLLFVLYLPLLLAWQLEHHFKARFIAGVVRRQGSTAASSGQGSQYSQGTAAYCPSDSSTAGGANSSPAAATEQVQGASTAMLSDQCNSKPAAGRVSTKPAPFAGSTCGVAPVDRLGAISLLSMAAPPASAHCWVRHLAVAASVCFALGEGFMCVCTVSPVVKGVFWAQIPPAPQ